MACSILHQWNTVKSGVDGSVFLTTKNLKASSRNVSMCSAAFDQVIERFNVIERKVGEFGKQKERRRPRGTKPRNPSRSRGAMIGGVIRIVQLTQINSDDVIRKASQLCWRSGAERGRSGSRDGKGKSRTPSRTWKMVSTPLTRSMIKLPDAKSLTQLTLNCHPIPLPTPNSKGSSIRASSEIPSKLRHHPGSFTRF